MSISQRVIAIVLSFILFTGILSAQESEDYQPTTFGERLHAGLISSDPNQWDDDTDREFFGNMPTEYRQKYFATLVKLCETNAEYWKVRAELFAIIHPVFTRTIEQSINERENNIRQMENQNDGGWVRGQLEQLKEIRDGDYSTLAKRYTDQHNVRALHSIWSAFHQYPEYLDPQKQTEYWNTLTEDSLLPYEQIIEILQQKIERQKRQITQFRGRVAGMTTRDLPDNVDISSGVPRAFEVAGVYKYILSLDEKQKSQIIGDEPFFGATDGFGLVYVFPYPRFPAYELLKEARDAEREPWKVGATPELSKLGITQAEIDRWDGSLSLHPFIRDIAGRSPGVTNLTRLQTTINHTSITGARALNSSTTLTNTHPALMAVINGEKDIVFSARRISQVEADAVAKQRAAGMRDLPPLPGIDFEISNNHPALPDTPPQEGKSNFTQQNDRVVALEDELVYVPFAKDAFVFLQNRRNPVRDLTLEQYQGIFSGQHPNWKDVGGFGGVIKPFLRNIESGSEELMQTLVMKGIPVHKDFQPVRLSGMSMVFEGLESFPTGIAYSIYHYDRYMVFNPNTRVMAVNGVFPNADTIASGEYPLVYETVLVHRKEPGERVERFVQWLLSEEGQRLVRSVGYVPIKAL